MGVDLKTRIVREEGNKSMRRMLHLTLIKMQIVCIKYNFYNLINWALWGPTDIGDCGACCAFGLCLIKLAPSFKLILASSATFTWECLRSLPSLHLSLHHLSLSHSVLPSRDCDLAVIRTRPLIKWPANREGSWHSIPIPTLELNSFLGRPQSSEIETDSEIDKETAIWYNKIICL